MMSKVNKSIFVRVSNFNVLKLEFLKLKRCFSTGPKLKNQKTTHFGFESVLEEEKEQRVYDVFRNVAKSYDLMNDAMSMGVHRVWKDHFINRLAPKPGTKLLDVAGGTGDIAFRFLKYVESQEEVILERNIDKEFNIESTNFLASDNAEADSPNVQENSSSHVTVLDINQNMLDVGKERALENGIFDGISWVQGNAEQLPFEDNSFDAYTIAFGIRNCTHVDQVVREAYRVLKPGGRFFCLEFSYVPNPLLRQLYDQYSFQVIPVMGQVLAKDWQSYQYLVESIRQFPNQEKFARIIRQCGFKVVGFENLTFGVAAIHSGFKF